MKYATVLGVLFLLALPVLLSGCKEVKEGMDKAVFIEYDQSNNFENFKFDANTPRIFWGQNSGETGVAGGYYPDKQGFWVTYVICNLKNEGPTAQPFPYDVSKFYVEYDDEKYYYQPLQPYTYSSYPNKLPGTPQVTPVINPELKRQTQLGPNKDTFNKGYQPALNYRIAIYVHARRVDPHDQLSLRYEGYPNVLTSRGHAPLFKSLATTSDLATTCRPPG